MGGVPPASPLPRSLSGVSSAGRDTSLLVRLAGGFVLNLDHSYTPEQRVELLFSLPGSTMLDTLVGLLLAACLRTESPAPAGEGHTPAPQEQTIGNTVTRSAMFFHSLLPAATPALDRKSVV